MITFDVLNRFTGDVQFTAEIDCDENASRSFKLGLAVRWGVKNDADLISADLSYADLSSANLSYADLRYANLISANLSYANLRYADLSSADLSSADLISADLSSADLSSADLSSADLSYADLRWFKSDLWMILTMSSNEVPNLVSALKEGRVDGSTYEGECACLVGTLKKGRDSDLPRLPEQSRSPAEQWFSMIRKGDKPEDDSAGGSASKLALDWIEEWLSFQPTPTLTR